MLLLFWLMLFGRTVAWAQQSTGEILGTITDPTAAVVAGATVTILQPATGLTKTGSHDPNEILDARFVQRAEIESMIANNQITDGMTLTGLLLWLPR